MVYRPSAAAGSDSVFVDPDWHVFAASTLQEIDAANPAKLTKQLAENAHHRRIALKPIAARL